MALEDKKQNIDISVKMNPSEFKTITQQIKRELSGVTGDVLNDFHKYSNEVGRSLQNNNNNFVNGSATGRMNDNTEAISNALNLVNQLNDVFAKVKGKGNDTNPALAQAMRSNMDAYNSSRGAEGFHSFEIEKRFTNSATGIGSMQQGRFNLNSNYQNTLNTANGLYSQGRASNEGSLGGFDAQRDQRQEIQKLKDKYGKSRSSISKVIGSITRNERPVDDSIAKGRQSYAASKNLNSAFERQQNEVNERTAKLASLREDSEQDLNNRNKQLDALRNKAGGDNSKLTSDERAQVKNLEESIRTLDKFNSEIKEAELSLRGAKENLKDQKDKYNSAVTNGDVKVGHDPKTILGLLERRKDSLMLGTAAKANNNINNSLQSGNDIRRQIAPTINNAVMGNALNGGQTTFHADDLLQEQLSHSGVAYGKSATSMAGYAGALSSTGVTNSDRLANGASQMAGFSRYNNVSDETTNGIFNTLGQVGALGSNPGSEISNISKQFSGMLANNKLGGRAQEQAQGFQSILQNAQAQSGTLSKDQVGNLMAMQSTLSSGKGGKAFQGEQGAQQLNSLSDNIAANGFNDPVMRASFAGSNAKYSGQQGMYKLQQDMMEPLQHADGLSNIIKGETALRGGREGAVTKLMQMGLSKEAANKLTTDGLNGNLTQASLDKVKQEDEKSGNGAQKNAKKQYKASGNSTLDIQVAIDNEGQIKASDTMDGGRATANKIKGTVNQTGLGSMTASAVGGGIGALTGVGEIALGSGLKSGIGADLGALGKTKWGSSLTSKMRGTKFGGKALNGIKSFFGTGNAFNVATKGAEETASVGSRVASGTHFAGSVARGTEEAASVAGKSGLGANLLKGTSKLSPLLKGAGKLATPLMVASEGISAIQNLQGMNKNNRGRKIGESGGQFGGALGGAALGASIGSVIPGLGTVVGGAVGGIGGSLLGSKLGHDVGGGIGSLFDPKKKKSKGKKDPITLIQQDVHKIANLVSAGGKLPQGTAGSNGTNKNDNSGDNNTDYDSANKINDNANINQGALSSGGSGNNVNQNMNFNFSNTNYSSDEIANIKSNVAQGIKEGMAGSNIPSYYSQPTTNS